MTHIQHKKHIKQTEHFQHCHSLTTLIIFMKKPVQFWHLKKRVTLHPTILATNRPTNGHTLKERCEDAFKTRLQDILMEGKP